MSGRGVEARRGDGCRLVDSVRVRRRSVQSIQPSSWSACSLGEPFHEPPPREKVMR